MNEFWFDAQYIDTGTGAVLGELEAAPRIEAGDILLRRIGDIVLAREFPFVRKDFDTDIVRQRREGIAEWGGEACQAFGAWVRQVVTAAEGEQTIIQRHLRRLEVMGLGLGEKPLLRAVGATSMPDFRRKIGAPVGVRRGEYDDWGMGEYIRYAQVLEEIAGGMPKEPDYKAAGQRGEGPTLMAIRRSPFRTISQVNELNDFPDVEAMTFLDMVHWGSAVRRANKGMKLTTIVAYALSKRHRGPGVRNVFHHFGSWKDFVAQVDEQYESELETEAARRKANLAMYDAMIAEGRLPKTAASMTEGELLMLGGRIRLIEYFTPTIGQGNFVKVMRTTPAGFINALARTRLDLSAGRIELKAATLGVLNDILPLEDGLDHLVVTPEELEAELELKRKHKRGRVTRTRQHGADEAGH